jgi:hypothetical protein
LDTNNEESVSAATDQLEALNPTPAEASDNEAREAAEKARRVSALQVERSRRNVAASRNPDPLAHDWHIARGLQAEIIAPVLASAVLVADIAAADAAEPEAEPVEQDTNKGLGLSGQSTITDLLRVLTCCIYGRYSSIVQPDGSNSEYFSRWIRVWPR